MRFLQCKYSVTAVHCKLAKEALRSWCKVRPDIKSAEVSASIGAPAKPGSQKCTDTSSARFCIKTQVCRELCNQYRQLQPAEAPSELRSCSDQQELHVSAWSVTMTCSTWT